MDHYCFKKITSTTNPNPNQQQPSAEAQKIAKNIIEEQEACLYKGNIIKAFTSPSSNEYPEKKYILGDFLSATYEIYYDRYIFPGLQIEKYKDHSISPKNRQGIYQILSSDTGFKKKLRPMSKAIF